MNITGNDFIDLLYLCEDNEKIIKMRKELEIARPTLNEKFKEDGYVSIVSKDTRTEVFFSDISNFNQNIEIKKKCTIIFSGIVLYYKTSILLPFSIEMDDSLSVIIQKIGKEPDFHNEYLPTKIWKLQRNDAKDYLLYADFDEEDYTELVTIRLKTYDNNIKYLK